MNKKNTHEKNPRAMLPGYRLGLLPAMLMAAMGCANTAWAVEGGVIAAGAGAIKTQGNKTTISQSSDKMVVNWKNFNIGADQSVIVNQPGATSAVLNRVTTASPTQIDGTLKANGRVFVVNPAGVVFGSGAKVDVGSLVASTLNVDSQEFMNGGSEPLSKYENLKMRASGGEGQIVNNGKLTAQDSITLVGPQIVNSGVIRAKDVALMGATNVTMVTAGSKTGFMLEKQAANALVANYGSITANNGDVTLATAATGAMIGTVIQNTGHLEAASVSTKEGGSVVLSAKDGGKISVGGQLSADNGILVSADGLGGPSMHDVTIESGAKLKSQRTVEIYSHGGHVEMNGLINAADTVNIESSVMTYGDLGPETGDGIVTTNGKINANTVQLTSANININAPITAVKEAYAESYSGNLNQRANVTATNGSVTLAAGGDLIQSDGVKTSASDNVTLATGTHWLAYPTASNQIRAANVVAKDIVILGGDITLAGNLKADGNIKVTSRTFNSPCLAEACAGVLTGGHLTQSGKVVSTNGNVTFDASTSISQQRGSRTSAGNVVTLKSMAVETGKIAAGKQINVNADFARLGGKLTAPEINLPDNTENVKGKVRILPKSANL